MKNEDKRRDPTEAEQHEFDALYRKVLIACDAVLFGAPGSNKQFAQIMGGQDKIDRYHEIRQTVKVKLKSGTELGITTKLNG